MNEPATVSPITTPDLALQRGTLRAILEGAALTMSKDPTRPHMNGVLFEFDQDQLTVTSTDGHRLTRTTAYYFNGHTLPGKKLSLLIPFDQVIRFIKALKCPTKVADRGIELVVDGAITAEVDGAIHRLVPVDANFPPYEKVIPKERDKEGTTGCNAINVSAKYLGDVAKAAKHLAGSPGGVRWTVDGSRDPIRIDMHNQDAGTDTTIVIMPMRMD
jgi:DNA polymerase III sliding clamp (beta) subunit (PCNA family)